jgi:hypothetical protein
MARWGTAAGWALWWPGPLCGLYGGLVPCFATDGILTFKILILNKITVFARARKTDPPFCLVLSQTSAGKLLIGLRHRLLLISRSGLCSSQWPCLRPAERHEDQAARTLASSVPVNSKARPIASTAQAMRTSLFASAIASTLWCNRLLAASIQDLSP